MAAVAGMAFVAVHDAQGDAAIVWQGLVAFQTPIGLVNGFPQRGSIQLGVYVSHGFGAGHGMAQPTLPEPGCARHLQSVEASQPRPKQDYGGFGYRGREDARLRPAVGDGGNEQGGEMEHLIRVCDQAPKQVRASSPGDVSIPVRRLPHLRVPICEGFRFMPPSWFLRFWTDQA